MPARNPRINVVLGRPLYSSVQHLADKDGVSLSLKVRDLIKEALQLYEDEALSRFAGQRERSFSTSKSLTHKEVWYLV